MKAYTDIDSYIKDYPLSVQKLLRVMRATIKKAAPGAKEAIRYGIPTFQLNGNLVHFGGYKSHVSFYPGSTGVRAFQKELSSYATSKGTIQFPLDTPVPVALIRKITLFRVKENTEKKKASRGAYVKYHNDGTLWAKGKIVGGKMTGYWEWFRKDGSKMRSGNFKLGKQVGKWTTYDRKGRPMKVTLMK